VKTRLKSLLHEKVLPYRKKKRTSNLAGTKQICGDLKPLLKEDYRRPLGRVGSAHMEVSQCYNRWRHRFAAAFDLNAIFTPNYGKLEKRGDSFYCSVTGRKLNHPPKKFEEKPHLNVWKTRPRWWIDHIYPGWITRAAKISGLISLCVLNGINPVIVRHFRALSRLLWRIDWNGRFHCLTIMVRKELRKLCAKSGKQFRSPCHHFGRSKTRRYAYESDSSLGRND